MEVFLQSMLDNLPEDWRGTTFKNSELLGREQFSDNLLGLIHRQAPITTQELVALGNAEEQLRCLDVLGRYGGPEHLAELRALAADE